MLAHLGCPPEADWPYVASKFRKAPPKRLTSEAVQHEIRSYERIDGTGGDQLSQMLAALGEGLPFVFGSSLYESFESDAVAKSGQVPMPAPHEQMIGGHCMSCFGALISLRLFIVRNSWGAGWGDKGYCYIPFDYLGNADLTSDCWVIRA